MNDIRFTPLKLNSGITPNNDASIVFASGNLNSVMNRNNGDTIQNTVYYTPTRGANNQKNDETQWTSKNGGGSVQDGLYDCVNGKWLWQKGDCDK